MSWGGVSKTFGVVNYVELNKAAQIIMAREQGELDLIDRKVFNFLLNRVYGQLHYGEDGVFRVAVSEILDFLGHSSTDRLYESLRRLGTVAIMIDYVDEDGVKHSSQVRYLSYDMARSVDGWVEFAFDALLMRFLHNPKVFATLSLNTIRNFRSDYSARLYEIMALQVNKRRPVWEPTMEEFRAYMALADAYDRFDNLKRRVIDVAVDEVNGVAPFLVDVEEVRAGRGGKIVALKFTSVPKSSQTLKTFSEALPLVSFSKSGNKPLAKRDPNTVDLLSGKTDAERIPLDLSRQTIDAAVSMLGGRDNEINGIIKEWRDRMGGRHVRFPDRAFLTWLEIRLAKETDSSIALLDDDAITSLVEQWEIGQ